MKFIKVDDRMNGSEITINMNHISEILECQTSFIIIMNNKNTYSAMYSSKGYEAIKKLVDGQ